MENGTCISLENCPCSFHGLAYSVGSKIEQECTEWYVINVQLIISGYLTSWPFYHDICLKKYTFYWFFFQKFQDTVFLLFKALQGQGGGGNIYIFFYDVILLTSLGSSIKSYIHVMNCWIVLLFIITNLHKLLPLELDGSLGLLYWVP